MKPFGIAIDHQGNAWATGSRNSTLAVIGPRGNVIQVIPPEGPDGRTQLRRPMGLASDSRGNIWAANSDFADVPCPPAPPDEGPATSPSIALYHRDPSRTPDVNSPFTGGGLTIPWGIAVDGNDTVWVANFGFPFDLANPEGAPTWPAPNRVSQFCASTPPSVHRPSAKWVKPFRRMARAIRATPWIGIRGLPSTRRAMCGCSTIGSQNPREQPWGQLNRRHGRRCSATEDSANWNAPIF